MLNITGGAVPETSQLQEEADAGGWWLAGAFSQDSEPAQETVLAHSAASHRQICYQNLFCSTCTNIIELLSWC